jgi:nucleoside diphosphate kinase
VEISKYPNFNGGPVNNRESLNRLKMDGADRVDVSKYLDEDEKLNLGQIVDWLKSEELKQQIDTGYVTFAMIKPRLDTIGRDKNLTDNELSEAVKYWAGFKFKTLAETALIFDNDLMESFYGDVHKYLVEAGKPERWDKFKEIMISGATTVMILFAADGDAVKEWRQMIGKTDPVQADPDNSIRGYLAKDMSNNMVHGSDSIPSVRRETEWLANYLEKLIS